MTALSCMKNENENTIRISLKLYTNIKFKEDKGLNVRQVLCSFEDHKGWHVVTSIPSVPRITQNEQKLRKQD